MIDTSILSEPTFFSVVESFRVDSKYYGLPAISPTFYIVGFKVRNLEDPTIDPIGVYYYAGIRRYIWRDRFWSEYELPHRSTVERAALKLKDCGSQREAVNLRAFISLMHRIHDYNIHYAIPDNNQGMINLKTHLCLRVIYQIRG